ncbi:hypothetical protein W97_07177 [Coniosporium apollinis CBS 100218]|uniref:Uncharacterized protein n=1 Tax=Coniosporium apollinis (strain CBS 100218) TaxID=1168221 RepID=R7Z1W1_CONA1|nr:uncharacterized protein W97_07177 [Coniosporium apollinis CBS 100218]EON68029.1 hypothetical protein W97_07177 [Coniosporium apollinis CBS 100218]
MSSGMMDTAPGGETPQYESINTVTQPHATEPGQMGGSGGALSTSTDPTASQSEATAEQGEKTAEKIRFGQKMSEEGMGGQTDASIGDAQQEGGLGGADVSANEESAAQSRREQGYGGDEDMDRTIGA